MNTWARQCEATGEGMNTGYLVDGVRTFKYESGLLDYLRSQDYVTAEGDSTNDMTNQELLEWAYNDELYFWTDWEDPNDHQYKEIHGVVYDIDMDETEIALIEHKRIDKDNGK